MPDLRQLKYFVALVRQMHFGHAARELGIAQPSLSQTIRTLEESLGVPLLVRTSRSVKLTASGTVFYQSAVRILDQMEQACQTAQRAARGEHGQLAIGFVSTAIVAGFNRLIQLYHEYFPSVRLVLREMPVDELIEQLHLGAFDLICTDGDVIDDMVESVPIPSPPWVLAVHRTSPLAERRSLTLAEAAEQPFLVATDYAQHSLCRKMIETFQSAQFMPDIRGHADSAPAALAMVEAKLGMCLVYHLPRYRPADVLFKKVNGPNMSQRMGLSWRRGDLSPAAANFLRFADWPVELPPPHPAPTHP